MYCILHHLHCMYKWIYVLLLIVIDKTYFFKENKDILHRKKINFTIIQSEISKWKKISIVLSTDKTHRRRVIERVCSLYVFLVKMYPPQVDGRLVFREKRRERRKKRRIFELPKKKVRVSQSTHCYIASESLGPLKVTSWILLWR